MNRGFGIGLEQQFRGIFPNIKRLECIVSKIRALICLTRCAHVLRLLRYTGFHQFC